MKPGRLTNPIAHVALLCGCVLVAVPLVGFFGGMIICEGCGGNPLAYLFMGLIHALITTLAGGWMWTEHDELTNVWPYILPTGITIYGSILVALHWLRRGTGASDEPSE